LKQEARVQMLQASQQQVLRQPGVSLDEPRSHPQVRRAARHPERLQDQLRERVPQRRVLRRRPTKQQAPRQKQASRRRP
jgi:hypothetical protein